MIREAIEKVVELAPSQSRIKLERAPWNPRKYIIDQGGTHTIVDEQPPLRSHVVSTLGDLISFVNTNRAATNPVIWHGPEFVKLILDDGDRRESVHFPLYFSRPFAELQKLAAADDPTFEPRKLANWLKIKMAGCEIPTDLINALRKLKWTNSSTTVQTTDHGRESLGRDIEAQLTANVDIPESVIVQTPIYLNVGEERKFAINCVVDPRPFDQKIAVIPLPGEIDDAINLHQADLRNRIVDALPSVPVFAGNP